MLPLVFDSIFLLYSFSTISLRSNKVRCTLVVVFGRMTPSHRSWLAVHLRWKSFVRNEIKR